MRNLIYIVVFFSIAASAQPQDNFSNGTYQANGLVLRSFDTRFKGVEGFSTLFEEYSQGKIYMVSGKVINNVPVNYDLMTDEVLVMHDNREMVVNNKLVARFVVFRDGDSLQFVRPPVAPWKKFCERIVTGEVNLYKVTSKTLQGPTSSGEPYSGNKTYSELVQRVDYFWQKGDSALVEVKNKKTLLNDLEVSLGKDYAELLKKEKISVKEGDDLRRLFVGINRSFSVAN